MNIFTEQPITASEFYIQKKGANSTLPIVSKFDFEIYEEIRLDTFKFEFDRASLFGDIFDWKKRLDRTNFPDLLNLLMSLKLDTVNARNFVHESRKEKSMINAQNKRVRNNAIKKTELISYVRKVYNNKFAHIIQIIAEVLYIRMAAGVKYFFNRGTFKKTCNDYGIISAHILRDCATSILIEYSTLKGNTIQEIDKIGYKNDGFWNTYFSIFGKDVDWCRIMMTREVFRQHFPGINYTPIVKLIAPPPVPKVSPVVNEPVKEEVKSFKEEGLKATCTRLSKLDWHAPIEEHLLNDNLACWIAVGQWPTHPITTVCFFAAFEEFMKDIVYEYLGSFGIVMFILCEFLYRRSQGRNMTILPMIIHLFVFYIAFYVTIDFKFYPFAEAGLLRYYDAIWHHDWILSANLHGFYNIIILFSNNYDNLAMLGDLTNSQMLQISAALRMWTKFYVPAMLKCKTITEFVDVVLGVAHTMCLHPSIADFMVNNVDIKSMYAFAENSIKLIDANLRGEVLPRTNSNDVINGVVQLDPLPEVNAFPPVRLVVDGGDGQFTGLQDVFMKLIDSKFTAQVQHLAGLLQFSTFLQCILVKVDPNGVCNAILSVYRDLITASKTGFDVFELWNTLISEVLPAFYYADANRITSNNFNLKVNTINKAIGAGKTMDTMEMLRVIQEWILPAEAGDVPNILLTFHDTLLQMIKFCHDAKKGKNDVIFDRLAANLALLDLSIRQNMDYGSKRITPFSIGIYGEAGVGKTTLTRVLPSVLAQALDLTTYPQGDDLVVKPAVILTDNDKFFDGVSNNTEVIVLDDMGTAAPDKVQKGNNVFMAFMQIQGGILANIPRSDIESKRNQFYNNKLTIATSNFEDFGSQYFVRFKPAFERRMHVKVKLERVPEVKYSVSFVDFPSTNRKYIEFNNERDFFLWLINYAIAYRNGLRNYDEVLTVTSICKTCRNMKNLCTCVRGLMLPKSLIQKCRLRDIVLYMCMEDVVSYVGYDVCVSMCGISYGSCLAALLREFCELIINGQLNIVRLVYFGSVMYLCNFPISVLLHQLFNASLILDKLSEHYSKFEKRISDACDKVEVRLIRAAQLVINDTTLHMEEVGSNLLVQVANLIIPKFCNDYLVANMQAFEDIKRALGDAIMSTYTLKLGFGVFSAAVLYSYIKDVKELHGLYTQLGEPANDDDIAASSDLDSMIQGSYEPIQHGLASSWNRENKPIVKKGSGTIPRSIHNNIVSISVKLPDGNISRVKGVLSDGRIFTVRHAIFNSVFEKRDISYSFIGSSEIHAWSFAPNSVSTVYTHDMISFPCISQRRTVKILWDYKMVKGDIVIIGSKDEEFEVMCRVGPMKIVLGVDSSIEEPIGAYQISYRSALGDSGLPVYLHKREGQSVEHVLIGILSRINNTTKYAIFVPFVCDGTYSHEILEEPHDANSIKEAFLEMGKEIFPDLSKNSDLKHIADTSQIGELVGHIKRYTTPSETNFKKTELYDKVCEFIPDTKKYVLPELNKTVKDGVYRSNMLACVRQMSNTGHFVNDSPAWSAANMLYKHLLGVIGDDLDSWKPMTLTQILKGTSLTNSINRKTSIGFPFSGVIKDDVFCGSYDKPLLKSWFARRIHKLLRDMDEGKSPLNISTTAIKDEIIKEGKFSRIFFAGNFDFLILCRAYLGPLLEIFTSKRNKLAPKIGMNAIGPEFDQFLKEMFEHANGDTGEKLDESQTWIDSDFEKYDKVLITLRYAIHVIWWLALKTKHFSSNAKDRNRLKLILQALLQYIVILAEEVFIFNDKIPSGVWATALINCLCEWIIEILMFYFLIHIKSPDPVACDFVQLYCDHIPFFKFVALSNYGDDNLKNVHIKFITIYTHQGIMQFSKWIHMGMTPARKHETEIKPKRISEILFLKRTPEYNNILERYVGKLEIGSIGKMLAYTDSVDPTWQVAVLDQARRELAFHGNYIYDKFFEVFELKKTKTIEETLKEIDSISWSDEDQQLINVEDASYTSTAPCQGSMNTNLTSTFKYEDVTDIFLHKAVAVYTALIVPSDEEPIIVESNEIEESESVHSEEEYTYEDCKAELYALLSLPVEELTAVDMDNIAQLAWTLATWHIHIPPTQNLEIDPPMVVLGNIALAAINEAITEVD